MYKQNREMKGNTNGKCKQIDSTPPQYKTAKAKLKKQILSCSAEEMEEKANINIRQYLQHYIK